MNNRAYTVLHSKTRFEYLVPRPETILLEDIAHSLAQICRFTGHTYTHYSVAQHSVLLSYLVSPTNALWALMHDAAECYVNDLAMYLKRIIHGHYGFVEDIILGKICEKFGLPLEEPEEVKRMDYQLSVNELRDLIDPDYTEEEAPCFFDTPIRPWDSVEAKRKFLQRYNELKVK